MHPSDSEKGNNFIRNNIKLMEKVLYVDCVLEFVIVLYKSTSRAMYLRIYKTLSVIEICRKTSFSSANIYIAATRAC